ncbi:MAG: NUDIX domain-containing protein [Dehalococcoidales bacterium]|nr:NUDIX domain-containing protein [Dehalococcoidales bacterium]
MNESLQVSHVVTCFLEAGGKILVLLRSEKVGTYRGKWGGVAGYIESTPDVQARTEIREETGLQAADIRLVKKGAPLTVNDTQLQRQWIVHPFLFHVINPRKIKIDWEHREMKWIEPAELAHLEAVPGLKESLLQVMPPRSPR